MNAEPDGFARGRFTIDNPNDRPCQCPTCKPEPERHLTTRELAARLGVPVQTLAVWRMKGTGPRGMRIGKYVRYRLSDVLEWEQKQLDKE